uniref:Uncharacterized protein n=1 Tax=Acrobeloides nanus TaxID=290746 RepID=A0A914C0A3_9BILA
MFSNLFLRRFRKKKRMVTFEKDPLQSTSKYESPDEINIRRRRNANLSDETSELEDEVESEAVLLPRRAISLETGEPLEVHTKLSIILGDETANETFQNDVDDVKIENSLLQPRKLGVVEFVWQELTRGYSLQNDEGRYMEKRRKVYAFLRIPYELEKFLFFGFLQCLDAFCHVFTILPIRILIHMFGSLFCVAEWTAANTCDILKILIIIHMFGSLFCVAEWTAANTCDILKILIIVISCCCMQMVDTSILYHLVRGQGVIKLYIFYNMLEVADKLFSSFGQDILDALLWTATEKGGKRKAASTLLHLFFAIVYSCIHALLILLQATTLNVAFNSHNQALLTIMMSNNFVELKGAVFKKFAKPNLFQMSCSDVRERFHTVILLLVVVLRNMTAVNWKLDHLTEMVPDLVMVIIAELIVDWLKHAFITKFNEISADVYHDFTITLAYDVVRSREESAFSDFSDQVSRRMGFPPIPIAIMLVRVIIQSVDFTSNFYSVVFVLIWFLLIMIKIINGIFLYGKSVDHVINYRNLQAQAEYELYRKRMFSMKSKSAPSSPKLSLVDFSDVLNQATKEPSKGFTVSDLLSNWDELSSLKQQERYSNEPSPQPRRCQSMLDFGQRRRDASLPPTIPEGEERKEDEIPEVLKETPRAQNSPKRRIPPHESLSEVQAYTLLDGPNAVQEIRS